MSSLKRKVSNRDREYMACLCGAWIMRPAVFGTPDADWSVVVYFCIGLN